MSDQGKRDDFRLGFFTALDDGDRGLVGGLLVTNRYGRPLEFQCTSPIKPNRTQEILYGPTLKPYLLSEVIGRTLVEKAGVKPHLVLAEQSDMLDLRDHIAMPVAYVQPGKTAGDSDLKLGNCLLRFHQSHPNDRKAVEPQAEQIPTSADLKEPFQRVREALQEAMKTSPR